MYFKKPLATLLIFAIIITLAPQETQAASSYTISWQKPLVSNYPRNPGGYIGIVFPPSTAYSGATCSKQIQYMGLDRKWHTADPRTPGAITILAGTPVYFHMYDNGGHTESKIIWGKSSGRVTTNQNSINYRVNNLITVVWYPNTSTALKGFKGCCNRAGEPVVWQIYKPM